MKKISLYLNFNHPGSFKVNVALSFLGNVAYNGFKWLMLSLLAKMSSTEIVGTFSLGTSIVAPIFTMTCLNLRTLQVTDVEEKHSFSDYFAMRLLTIVISSIITLVVATGGSFDSSTRTVVILFIGSYIVEMLCDIINGYWQQQEKMIYVSISLLLRGFVGLFTFSSTFWITKSLPVSIFTYICSLILVCYFYDISNIKKSVHKLYSKIDKATIIHFIILAFPLTIVSTANAYASNIPKWIIESSIGRDALGIFSAIANISIIGSLVINAVGYTLIPRYAKLLKEKNIKDYITYIRKTQIYGTVFNIILILTLLVFGKKILTVLYTNEYAGYSDILVLMSIADGIGYLSALLGTAITAAKVFRKQMWINVFVCILIFVLGLVLIPQYGLYGTCYALILSNIVKYFIHTLFLKKIIRDKYLEA